MQNPSKILWSAVALAAASAAFAGPGNGGHQAAPEANLRQYMIAKDDGPSLKEAVERVRRQYHGRIVSAETKMRGKREIHVIKVLTEDGKVKTITIPGRSRGA